MVDKDDYGKLKEEIFKVVNAGVTLDDLLFVKEFLQSLLRGLK